MSEYNAKKGDDAPITARLLYYIGGHTVTIQQDFPATRLELKASLERAGMGAQHLPDVLDAVYKTAVPELDRRLPRRPNLDELNVLAHRLEGLSDYEEAVFDAVMQARLPFHSLEELINLTHNLDQFDFFPGGFSEKEFGGIMAEMHGNEFWAVMEELRASDEPRIRDFAAYVERLERSIDLQAYGVLARGEEAGILTTSGYLLPPAGELPKKYTGLGNAPEEYLLTARHDAPEKKPSLLGAIAAAKEKLARQHGDERGDIHNNRSSGPER